MSFDFVLIVICINYFFVEDGEVYSWGSNAFGQLGLGNSGFCLSMPMMLTSLQWTPVRQITAGGSHSAILSCTGAIYVWGKNEFGQLGLSDVENRCLPTLQKSLRNQKIAYINLGDEHSAALTFEGGLFTWGAGMYGQLGHGRNTNEVLPRKIFELMGVRIVQVSCGRCHTLVVSKQGRIYSFGLNGSGQLGIGNTCSKYLPVSICGPWSELNTKDVIVRDNQRSLLLFDESVDEQEFRKTYTSSANDQTMDGSSSSSASHQSSDLMMEINEMETIVSEDEEKDIRDNQNNNDNFIIEEPEEDRYNNCQQQHQPCSQAKFVCANDTVFDESNLSLQIDEYESDPDSDEEEGPNRLQYICKEIVAGKGDHSFVLTQSYMEQIMPKDSRRLSINDEILKMKNQIFEQFPSISKESSIPLDIVDYIETIFSSFPSMNASFLCSPSNDDNDGNNANDNRNNHNDDERKKLQKFKQQENIHFEESINFCDGWINWQQAFHCFNMIEDAQNERIDELIYQLLCKIMPNMPDLTSLHKRRLELDDEKYKNKFPDILDEEVMRVYQILPLFHMFRMPTYCERSQKLITAYATSLNTLSERGIGCMKIRWYYMNRRFFKNLIEIFKNSVKLNLYEQYKASERNSNNGDPNMQLEYNSGHDIFHQQSNVFNNLTNRPPDSPSSSSTKHFFIPRKIHFNLAVCLFALKRLYSVNKFSGKISHKEFYIHGISDWFDLRYDYYLWKNNRIKEPNVFYLCNYPFIFDPPAKTIILIADSAIQQESAANLSIRKQILMSIPIDGTIQVNPFIDISVRRDNIVEDTIHQLCLFSRYGEADLKKPLRVLFSGEEAIDAGRGMKKEFFLLVMKEMLDQKYGMFVEYKETNTIWFNHVMTDEDDVMYRLVGILCGLAIYNQVFFFV